jgi:hypothetical protein
MNNDRIDYLLNKILSGILIFYYNDQEYRLKPPDAITKYKSCLLYDKIINDEKYSDWIRESDMTRIMIRLGLWENDSDKMLKSLEKTIEDNKLKLYENLKRPDVLKLTRKSLQANKNRLNHLLYIKNNFRNNTLEGYAESIKSEYIICNTLYHKDAKIFENIDINSKNDYEYKNFNVIVQEIYKQSTSVDDIRALSRSALWKTYWIANKDNIFVGAVCDWTDDQRSLVNYSRMYDNVYDHPDCPEDSVIEDDDILDGWFIYQRKKREKEKNQSKFNSGHRNKKLDNAQEIFLMPNDNQTAEEIMDLNNPIAKARFKQKMQFLSKADGEIQECKMPDVQMDIMNQRAEMKRTNKK